MRIGSSATAAARIPQRDAPIIRPIPQPQSRPRYCFLFRRDIQHDLRGPTNVLCLPSHGILCHPMQSHSVPISLTEGMAKPTCQGLLLNGFVDGYVGHMSSAGH